MKVWIDATTIAACLEERRRRDGNRLAFASGTDSMTFGELAEDAERLAALVHHDGVGSGDRIVVALHAGLDLIRVFFWRIRFRKQASSVVWTMCDFR